MQNEHNWQPYFSYDLHWIDGGVNIAGVCNASCIVIAFNACWMINRALVCTPPGIRVNVIVGLGRGGVVSLLDLGGVMGLGEMGVELFHFMAGTPPGVLFYVCL
jgi:hypothetical protein